MQASLTLWQKYMQKSLVHGEEIFGFLIQPILWVVLFGVGMRGLFSEMLPEGGSDYITYMLPGIIALTAIDGAIGGGSTWLNERLRGIVKEYLVAPIPRLSILLGNALAIITRSVLQALLILVIGILMGANLSGNPLHWLLGFLLIFGYGLGFSGRGPGAGLVYQQHGSVPQPHFYPQPADALFEQRPLPAVYPAGLDARRGADQPDHLRHFRDAPVAAARRFDPGRDGVPAGVALFCGDYRFCGAGHGLSAGRFPPHGEVTRTLPQPRHCEGSCGRDAAVGAVQALSMTMLPSCFWIVS
jgi:hypothetical protein